MKGLTPQGEFERVEVSRGVSPCSQSMPTPEVANNRQMTTSHDIGS